MAQARFRKSRKSPRLSESVDPPRPRGPWARVIGWLFAIGVVGAISGAAVVAGIFLYYGSDPDLPNVKNLSDYRPRVVSRVLDRNGTPLGEIYEERRTVVPRARIPDVMVHAIVDAEDAQFFEHRGLNYWGMLRAALKNLRPGAHLQGASTITQQLVKTYLLKTNERTLKRKVQEAILARRLESQLTKDDILYLYLNQIYLGHNRYGVEEAARYFFDKSISNVSIAEAALLASLPKGPEDYTPFRNAEKAKKRQQYVLSQMLRYQHITQADYDRYVNAPIELVKRPTGTPQAPAAEFVDQGKKALSARFGDKALPFLGTTVKTTCDVRVQKMAREALERTLEALDERQGYRKAITRLKTVNAQEIRRTLEERALRRLRGLLKNPSRAQRQRWLEEREKALHAGKVTEVVVVEVRPQVDEQPGAPVGLVVDAAPERAFLPAPLPIAKKDDPTPVRGDRYNPKGLPVEKRFAVGDVITVRVEPTLGRVEIAGWEAVGSADDKPLAKEARPAADGRGRGDDKLPVVESRELVKGRAAPPAPDEKDADGPGGEGEEPAPKGLPISVPEFGPQGAVVVIDPVTREVLSLVGGYGFRRGGFDRSIMARRQPGSAFKPFVYAAAFKTLKYTPATILNDSPQIFEQPGLEDWKPKNAEAHEFLGPVRLRTALARSLNTVAAQIVYDIKPGPVAEVARACGIESPLDDKALALGLGASGVTLLEITNAYATFAANGKRAAPRLLQAVAEEAVAKEEPQQVLDAEVAFLVTSMMQSVIDEGTGASAKSKLKGRPAAGKTGTTSSERDAWFVGYTPDLVVGVWVGFDDMRDLGHGEQGARSALPVWTEVLGGALKGVPPSPFAQPAGVEVRKIDPVTGLLATPGQPNALDEYFLPGTAPQQTAPIPGEQNPDIYMIQ